MKKTHGTYRHFRQNENGELIDLGLVNYSYHPDDCDIADNFSVKCNLIDRNQLEIETNARLCEEFESLVDAACEMEG